MQRTLAIAAFVLLFTTFPLSAQRGGGHAGGGGHGGGGHASFGGGHIGGGGPVSGGHAFSGGHAYSGAPAFRGRGPISGTRPGSSARSFNQRSSNQRSFNQGSPNQRSFNRGSVNSSLRARNHSGVGLRIRTYPYGAYYGYPYGYGYAYPYLYGGIDPYWWWDSGSNSSDAAQYDDNTVADANDDELVVPYRPDTGNQNSHAKAAPRREQEAADILPATVLVFRDQHTQEVRNYAIVGETLWSFAPQRTQKIPLSDLDIPATTKANDERGVSFRLPGAGEGQ